MRSTPTMFRTLLLTAALAAPVTVQAQFTEGFDDIDNLPGWYFQNNSSPLGLTDWFQGASEVFFAFSGHDSSYVAANFNNVLDRGTISNWMLTPPLLLEDGSIFSFYTRKPDLAGTFPDRLELRLSTSDASTDVGNSAESVGAFDRLLLSINPGLAVFGYPDDWTKYSVTLSQIGTPTMGRFGFRYFVTNAGSLAINADYIGIDDVTYDAVNVVPEPSTVVLLGGGLLAFGIARRRRLV